MKKLIIITIVTAAFAGGTAFAGPGNDAVARAAAVSGLAPVGEYTARQPRPQTTIGIYKSGEKSHQRMTDRDSNKKCGNCRR